VISFSASARFGASVSKAVPPKVGVSRFSASIQLYVNAYLSPTLRALPSDVTNAKLAANLSHSTDLPL